MTIHGNITATFYGLLPESFHPQRNIVIMTMSQQNPMVSQLQLNFPLQNREKIIVSFYHFQLTVFIYPILNQIFAALSISQMNQHIKRGFLFDYPLQVIIFPVRIAYNQYFHQNSSSRTFFSWAFIASRAFPLWLILFFSSIVSSAEVFPNSGR